MPTLAVTSATQAAPSTRRKVSNPIVLWHLLSLDAPAVAAVWTWFIARVTHVGLSPLFPAAMFVAVWIIYASDRLLDSKGDPDELEARHLFHHAHRRIFLIALPVATIGLVALLLLSHLPAATIAGYGCVGLLLLLWMGLVHNTSRSHVPLPKELTTGVIFSLAVWMPALTGTKPGMSLLECATFALLATLNGVLIDAWEHRSALPGHAITRVLRYSIPQITVILLVLSTAAALLYGWAFPLAIVSSLSLHLLAHRKHHAIEPTVLRATADLLLLTPLLILPWLK